MWVSFSLYFLIAERIGIHVLPKQMGFTHPSRLFLALLWGKPCRDAVSTNAYMYLSHEAYTSMNVRANMNGSNTKDIRISERFFCDLERTSAIRCIRLYSIKPVRRKCLAQTNRSKTSKHRAIHRKWQRTWLLLIRERNLLHRCLSFCKTNVNKSRDVHCNKSHSALATMKDAWTPTFKKLPMVAMKRE